MTNEFPTYTDMKRTRVIERGSVYTMPRENASIGSTQPIAKKDGLFDGISIGQIAASAAAAATSMLLASKIGIAGSVIGAAVSSAVTIVATQLYRRALSAGARKLQNATFDAVRKPSGAHDPRETTQMNAHTPYAQAYASACGARVAPTKLQARAAAQRANTQRKVIIASIAVAALSLALVSGAIMLATAGEGLGARPKPIFTAQSTGLTDTDAQADTGASLSPENGDTTTDPDESSSGASQPNNGAGDVAQDQGTAGDSSQAENNSLSDNASADNATGSGGSAQQTPTDQAPSNSQGQDQSSPIGNSGSANAAATSSGAAA